MVINQTIMQFDLEEINKWIKWERVLLAVNGQFKQLWLVHSMNSKISLLEKNLMKRALSVLQQRFWSVFGDASLTVYLTTKRYFATLKGGKKR